MTQKEILLAQFAASYNEEGWFVPLRAALDGLTAQEAARHDGATHSVWQTVNHLIFWNTRYLNRFNGVPNTPMTESNAETFSENNGTPSDDAWQAALAQLDAVMKSWQAAIAAADDSKLQTEATPKQRGSWFKVITNLTLHTAYHTGQILLLRKQHGTWNETKA
jgi:uncharacterized damage-inducible protein DinB